MWETIYCYSYYPLEGNISFVWILFIDLLNIEHSTGKIYPNKISSITLECTDMFFILYLTYLFNFGEYFVLCFFFSFQIKKKTIQTVNHLIISFNSWITITYKHNTQDTGSCWTSKWYVVLCLSFNAKRWNVHGKYYSQLFEFHEKVQRWRIHLYGAKIFVHN